MYNTKYVNLLHEIIFRPGAYFFSKTTSNALLLLYFVEVNRYNERKLQYLYCMYLLTRLREK